MEKEYKVVPGFPGYEIASDGTIVNIISGLPLQPKSYDQRAPYPSVMLTNHGHRKRIAIHRLVALVFVPNPENKPEVHHIDADVTNYNATNLRWVTRSENLQAPDRLKKMEVYYNTVRRQMTATNPSTGERRQFLSITDAAKAMKTSTGSIWNSLNTPRADGTKRLAGGCTWEYA